MWWIALIVAILVAVSAGVWLVHFRLEKSSKREGYHDQNGSEAAAASMNRNMKGIVLHATTLSPASYPNSGGRVWKSLMMPPKSACPEGGSSAGLLHLGMAPSDMAHFDRLEGFPMGRNKITGPLCSALGIQLDRAFSIALVFKADLASRRLRSNMSYPAVTLLHLYANTTTNNGVKLTMDPSTNALQVTIGSNPTMKMSKGSLSLVHGKHYALIVVKDTDSTVRILLADLSTPADASDASDASTRSFDVLLQGRALIDQTETFSNREMAVNETGNWRSGRLLEVRMYRRSIKYEDISDMRSTIQAQLEDRSPSQRKVRDLERKLRNAQKCPYDAAACAACGGIVDWMGVGALDVALTGGPACVSAVAEFCNANPEHSRCTCWNASNPEYHGTCRNVRAAFGDKDALPKCPEAEEVKVNMHHHPHHETRKRTKPKSKMCKIGIESESESEYDDSSSSSDSSSSDSSFSDTDSDA